MPGPPESVTALAHFSLSGPLLVAARRELGQVEDWQQWLAQLELYGVSALAFKHVGEHSLSVPLQILIALRALALRHRAAADARYQVMQELLIEFATHQIPLVALKGVALAPMIYPADELRPMRDIDVLVPNHLEPQAAGVLRQMGFELPDTQPTKFMRASHQLPNATKTVNGFTVSVEVHHDALTQNVPEHLLYEDVQPFLQTVQWRDLQLLTLGHEQMLHQVSRHLEGLHPGAVLKLVNVLDVVMYSETFIDEIDWGAIKKSYPHVINTLKCLHMIVPLSAPLQAKAGGVPASRPDGVGVIMRPLTAIINKHNPLRKQLRLLFAPSDWWLHLYYNREPDKSLLMVKMIRHPLRVCGWLAQRLHSRLLGG